MSQLKEIEKAVQRLSGTYLKDIVSILICNVDSVDFDNRTCDCTPISGDADSALPGVLLCAENDNGLVVSPKVDSTIIVALSTRNTAFVLMFSEIDKVQFMDGSYGGFTKTQELKTQIDKLNAQLQAVIDSLKNWTPVPNDGGAALKTYFGTAISGKDPGDFSDIENTLLTHGINP